MISLGGFFMFAAAVALAAPMLVQAAVDRPPRDGIPRPLAAVAAGWALAFLGTAIVFAVQGSGLAVIGLLVAASELAGAAAIWFARSQRVGGDDHGGGPGGPDGPHPAPLPEEYWRRWEEQFQEHAPLRR